MPKKTTKKPEIIYTKIKIKHGVVESRKDKVIECYVTQTDAIANEKAVMEARNNNKKKCLIITESINIGTEVKIEKSIKIKDIFKLEHWSEKVIRSHTFLTNNESEEVDYV